MPLYNSQAAAGGSLQAISPGHPFPGVLFNAESPLTGQRSVAVAIQELGARRDTGLALELIFSGNPGAFNFQIQGSDSDKDGVSSYFTEGSGTITSSTGPQADGTFRARVELSPWMASFVLLFISAQTANAVTVTARVIVI